MSRFNYFFRGKPQVLAELKQLGIQFVDLDLDGEIWPAFKLPSGTVIAIARDDEGNGPGALHVFTPDQLES